MRMLALFFPRLSVDRSLGYLRLFACLSQDLDDDARRSIDDDNCHTDRRTSIKWMPVAERQRVISNSEAWKYITDRCVIGRRSGAHILTFGIREKSTLFVCRNHDILVAIWVISLCDLDGVPTARDQNDQNEIG